MKRARFTEEQIISILKQAEAEVRVADLCRQHVLLRREGRVVNHKRTERLYRKKNFRCA